MSGDVCASINSFPAGCAQSIPILPADNPLWGILERLDPAGDGLLRVTVSAREYLVDESLHESLASLVGQSVAICRIAGRWGAGALAL